MTTRPTRTHKTLAGWIAFASAIALSVISALGRMLGRVGDHTETIGLTTAFLAFAAACFGLKTYEAVAEGRSVRAPGTREAEPPSL